MEELYRGYRIRADQFHEAWRLWVNPIHLHLPILKNPHIEDRDRVIADFWVPVGVFRAGEKYRRQLTRKDIDGLSLEQIKQLRGY